MMSNFESEYPFGDFLEDYKFEKLSDFQKFHCQKQNAVNTIAKSNIPMHALIFYCWWDTKSLYTISSFIFNSLSIDMRFVKTLSHWFFKQTN